jgi:acetyl-CoA synthetase
MGHPGAGGGSGSAGDAAAPDTELSQTSSGAGVAPRETAASAGLVFDDPLDRPSSDDTDRGWGDPLSGSADDDFTRFLSEKPPHHL